MATHLRAVGGATLPYSSGDAALTVRRRWEELRNAGFLDDPRLEFARPPVRWHWSVIVAAGIVALGCVVPALAG